MTKRLLDMFFVILLGMVLAAGCADKRVTGKWKTGMVYKVTCDSSGKIIERKEMDPDEQGDWLRMIGAPEDIISKAQKGEKLSSNDQDILAALMEKNSEEPRESPIRSISRPGLPGLMIVPRPSVRPRVKK